MIKTNGNTYIKLVSSEAGILKLNLSRYASVREQKQKNTSIRSIDQRGRKLRITFMVILASVRQR